MWAVHALQRRQHEKAIPESIVLGYFVERVARIVRVDRTRKD